MCNLEGFWGFYFWYCDCCINLLLNYFAFVMLICVLNMIKLWGALHGYVDDYVSK
jgi:hypothetical protein